MDREDGITSNMTSSTCHVMTSEQCRFVVTNEYSDIGLPGCVGSVDYVHIGWEQCPNQYFHMYTGKEGFPSMAAYEAGHA